METLRVRAVAPEDEDAWVALRRALWPDGSEDEHRTDVERFFAGRSREPLSVFVAELPARGLVGFAEASIRAYAEGCRTDHVAYLEGWYVVPELRERGVGRALVRAVEAWGRSQGCTEMASDAEVDNERSALAHRALGFEEVETIRCFRKDIQ